MRNPIEQFQSVMQADGFTPPEIIADGKPHRFDIDKRGDAKGFYILFADGVPSGRYGSWSEQEPGAWLKWSAKSENSMTDAERAENRKRWKKAQAERRKQLAEAHRLAAEEALSIWKGSSPASADNAYLARKKVHSHGINQQGSDLIIPVRINGELSSIQRINSDGKKMFLSGGAIAGGYHSIGKPSERIYIAEGYATGATIHEATGDVVAIAFNAGNLKPVAKAIHKNHPDIEIIIAGDNDQSNVGETKGRAAADAVGGKLVLPQFADGESGTDWNDFSAIHGLDAVRDKILQQLETVESAPVETAQTENEQQYKCPQGYSCEPSGVSIVTLDKDPEPITHKPIWVTALSRDGSRENWGRLIHWHDADGGKHERAIPAQLFHANGNELAQELASAGLPIIPGKERKLLQYLAAFIPEKRLTAAPATGWHGEAFVLPDRTINEPENERIIYQSVEYQNAGCIASRGTLTDWQTLMRNVSPIVKFAIACSLAAPVRFKAGQAAGGFHFYGRTSQGKTTMLQAASSVWGNACDPAMAGGADAYIQRWNATKNGLEGMASSFNDLPLIIDEIGEGEEKDFGRIIYQLMSGTGKQRANRTGGMRERRTWRILLLSNGELPVSDFIPNARGGQLIRLIDIPAKDMFTDREDADAMKKGCADVYGLAGPAFIESGNLLEGLDNMKPEAIGDALTPESGRVRDRFRLIAHAGELAIRRGILPWKQGDILNACKSVFVSWKETGHGISDADRGIANIRDFLLAYGESRFEQDDSRHRDPIDRAGWFRNDIYHFTDAAFKEACKGVLSDTAKKALKDKNLLHLSDSKRLKAQIKVEGKPVRVISVKSDILSSCENGAGTAGTAGTGQGAQGFEAYPPEETERVRAGTENEAVPTASTRRNGAGTEESHTGQGLYPPYPPYPPENARSEKVVTDEPDFGDDLPPVRHVAGGLLI